MRELRNVEGQSRSVDTRGTAPNGMVLDTEITLDNTGEEHRMKKRIYIVEIDTGITIRKRITAANENEAYEAELPEANLCYRCSRNVDLWPDPTGIRIIDAETDEVLIDNAI